MESSSVTPEPTIGFTYSHQEQPTEPKNTLLSCLYFNHRQKPYDRIGDVQDHGYRWRYDDYTTIDWIHDTIKDRIRHRKIKQNSKTFNGFLFKHYDAAQAWIVLFIVGVLSGIVASVVNIIIPLFEELKSGYCSPDGSNECKFKSWSELYGDQVGFIIYVSLGFIMAIISTTLVKFSQSSKTSGYHAAGSGIPEVKTILGGFVIKGFLGFKTVVVKTIALIFSISAGLAVGIQGPLVHISCAIGNITTRLFRKYASNDAKRREIMSASCAAGVSVAFGAPIGGVLFSLEEVSYYFPPKTMWRSFFCALIAALTIKIIDPFGTGKLVRFQVTYNSEWNHYELFSFLILGSVGGLYGAFFIKSASLLDRIKKQIGLTKFPLVEISIVSLLTGILSFGNEFTQMSNVVFMTELLSECKKGSHNLPSLCQYQSVGLLVEELGMAMAINAFLMIITFGAKVPGGVFIPSMVIGACFGRIYGVVFQYIMDNGYLGSIQYKIIPGVYAMAGAAGVVAGVTRMSVSLAVIMFELTGGLTYIVPIMTSIMVSKWAADAFGRDSIYDAVISQKGYPYLNYKHNFLSKPSTAYHIMESNSETIDMDEIHRLSDIREKCDRLAADRPSLDSGFPITKQGNILVGYISQSDLAHALDLIEYSHGTNGHSIVFHNLLVNQEEEAETPVITFPFYYAEDSTGRICDLSQWVDKAPFCVSYLCSSEMVVEIFTRMGIRTLLVTKDGEYLGMIQKKQLLSLIS